MADILKRKCAHCKEEILIDRNSIDNVLQYDGKYYHVICFKGMANEKATSKRGKPAKWQAALNNLQKLQNETKIIIEHSWIKDDLNDWLLRNYDIAAVPSRFWQVIAELEQGKYKGKRCKPIKIETLFSMWKWGQNNLNKIHANNKEKRQGPSNDNDRLRYDLAILLSHTGDYIKYITRTKDEVNEIAEKIEKANRFDYEKIYKESKKQEVQEDILDLMNDIF